MENSQSSFWQFSDQLRVHSNNLANLSLNDSIWSVNNNSNWKNPEERRNFDVRVGGNLHTTNTSPYTPTDAVNSSPYTPTRSNNTLLDDIKQKSQVSAGSADTSKINTADFNLINNNNIDFSWKIGSGLGSFGSITPTKNTVPQLNGGFNKGIYNSSPKFSGNQFYNNNDSNNNNLNGFNTPNHNNNSNGFLHKNFNLNFKGQQYYKNVPFKNEFEVGHGVNVGGKKKNKEGNKKDQGHKEDQKNGVEKRFKTLPPAEALPRNEMIGGYIFVCNNDTMEENLRRQLFGLPPRYRDSVRAITPGLPLFLYNYSTHQLHGIYEAASFGASNIDPSAWEDKKNPGESRFPAQVRVQTRRICEPMDEDAFRPILHHYDGPKFRLELSVPEALSLLDIFEGDGC